MNKIGILQGRLLPPKNRKLQVFPSKSWEQEFGVAKGCGFDCMELLLGANRWQNPLLLKDGQMKIMELSKITKMGVWSVCTDCFNRSNVFDQGTLIRLAEACQLIRCKTILLPFLKLKQRYLKYALSVCFHVVQNYKVTIGLETALPASELLSLMEKINHSHIGVYYDLGNSIAFGYNAAEDIRRLSKWICGIHIKDQNSKGENVILGTGLVNFSECFQALKDINYQGDYILETCMGDNPIEVAKYHLDFVKNYLEV